MEIPSVKRRKIVVIALSPTKTSVMVKQDAKKKWNIPDSHLDWEIGRRKKNPTLLASDLLKDFTLSLLGELKTIRNNTKLHSKRFMLPSGGFSFVIESSAAFDINKAVENANLVRKHLDLKEKIEMHSIKLICDPKSHSKYGNTTIEALRTMDLLTP